MYNSGMSWASRRRTIYLTGVIAFFIAIIGLPLAYWYFSKPATCFDGVQNQGETAPDKGGPCLLLDERSLQPEAILWARSFKVRDGTYNAVAYIQNSNTSAGVAAVPYRFSLYDAQNILIAEREGTIYLMPGGVTPIFESRIDTGQRIVSHTYFEFTGSRTWERMQDTASVLSIGNKQTTDISSAPRLTARASNAYVTDIIDVGFVAVVFDTAGNAFAASETSVARIAAGASVDLTFTWPDPFPATIGRIDIIPLVRPTLLKAQ